MQPYPGLEVWRGGVNTWECDDMGHLNVRFYVARAVEGLVGLAGAMGLPDAFRPRGNATLLIKDQHIRFMREARARAPLHMVAGLLHLSACEARVLQLLIHSQSGEICAAFQTVVVHATSADERPFAWSDRTRLLAQGLMMQTPEIARPRSIKLEAPVGDPSLAQADALGLITLASGAVGAQDCDIFGRMRAELFIGRVSDGVPRMAAAFRAEVAAAAEVQPARIGGAVLEYRLLHHAWPRAGDRVEIRSGLAEVDHRCQRLVHWMLDPVTGKAWGSAEAVAVTLDLDARKIVPIAQAAQQEIRKKATPGLRL